MFANIVWTQELANIPPCYVSLIQIIDGYCFYQFVGKVGKHGQGQKVGKHNPFSLGGAK